MAISSYDEGTVKNFITFFRNKGVNDNGIAGLLGNIYAESRVRTNNLQNSCNTKFGLTDEEFTVAVDNGTFNFCQASNFGYGLCQWTSYGRRCGLYNLAKSYNESIASEHVQFEWLWQELSTKYKTVLAELTRNGNTIASCAEIVVCKFEVPASVIQGGTAKENVIKTRTGYATEFYEKYLKGNEMTYIMTSNEYVEKAKWIATGLKSVYCYGGLGYHGTKAQIARVQTAHPAENIKPKITNADEDTWMWDCVGLLKSILWGFKAEKKNPQTGKDYNYGGAVVPSNGVPNVGAKAFFNQYCKNITKDFSTIKAGEAVWLNGNPDSHIGIYIGDGLVVECTPKWNDGVQITACSNIATVSGYHSRKWDYHGEIPWLDYSKSGFTTIVTTPSVYIVQKGDNLTKIAKNINAVYGTNYTYKTLADLNGIKFPYIIKVGQTLKLR